MMYLIAASRGRADGEWFSNPHQQHIEVNRGGCTNSITAVLKDNYVIEIYAPD